MRRPQSAFGLAAVMSSLLVAIVHAVPAGAAIAPAEAERATVLSAEGDRCTPWSSTTTPPSTIRVLRTWRTRPPAEVKGTVQEVDFFEYVATVMAAEWPEHYPLETLKAGAVVTKQFAWYYIVNPRGGSRWSDGQKVCYDVVDSTVDQWYQPERRGLGEANGPGPKILAALDVTWDISLRKYSKRTQSSRFFLTGYRSGSSSAACGEDANGFKLFHQSTRKCGEDRLKFREILRRYLRPNLEIVDPGRRNVIGTRHGDAAVLRTTADQYVAHVWTPGRRGPEPGSNAELSFSRDGLVGHGSADMDGDGREDLVWLRQTGPRSGTIRVALSDGVDYGPAEEWWSGDAGLPLASARLLLGDFHADQRIDVAILGSGETTDTSRLVVLKRKKYGNAGKLFDPQPWWTGSQDASRIRSAWAGDLSGDGRADLIVRQDLDSGGVRVRTAVTKSPLPASGPRMGPLQTRFESTTLDAAKVRMTAADANRDGREDLLLLIGGGGRARIERLQGQLKGGFKRVPLWRAPAADPVPVGQTRFGASDVDYDGSSDVVLYTKSGSDTRIRVLRTRYGTMRPGPDWTVAIAWGSLRPY